MFSKTLTLGSLTSHAIHTKYTAEQLFSRIRLAQAHESRFVAPKKSAGKFSFWLTSCGKGHDIMGISPIGVMSCVDTQVNLCGTLFQHYQKESIKHKNPQEAIHQVVTNTLEHFGSTPNNNRLPNTNRFALPGFYGYFSYSFINNQARSNPSLLHHKPEIPVATLGFYSVVISKDNQTQNQYVISGFDDDPQYHALVKLVEEIGSTEPAHVWHTDNQPLTIKAPLQANTDRQTYKEKFQHISDFILQGDAYQINFAQRFQTQFQGDSFEAFIKARENYPAPYSGYLSFPWGSIHSHSPELFLETNGNSIITKPIKGTMARAKELEEDQKIAQSLLNSEKNKAENLMIVDLLRNDLARSCKQGSVKLDSLWALETYANVHHLVSTITGELKDDISPLTAFFHAFPGGSITGAPKSRAMEIIDQLEINQRESYCGSLGFIDINHQMKMNINIRSILFVNDTSKNHALAGHLYCWGGGGIVSDSNCETEYCESIDKIKPLLKVLECFTDQEIPIE